MNYIKTYELIINNAKSRGLNKKLLNGYYEKHHIIPKCFGGLNNKDNLVYLSYKEHVICHHLLYKHYKSLFFNGQARNKEYYAMMYAYNRMLNKRKEFNLTFKQMENFRIEFSKNHSMLMSGEGNGFYGKKHSEETKKHLSEIKKRDFKGRIGKNNPMFGRKGKDNPRFGMKHTEDTKDKMSNIRIGKYKGSNHPRSCICIVDDIKFECQSEAVKYCKDKYGMKLWEVLRNFKDINNKNFIKVERI